MKKQKEVFEKIIESVDGKPVTFMGLCRKSGYSSKTVRRYLEMIEYVQRDGNRVEISRDGFRVVIRRSTQPKPSPY